MNTRRIVFVARSFTGESLRSALAITKLDNICLLGICEQPSAGDAFSDVVCVADTHDSTQLIEAARLLQQKHGALDRIVTTYETLLEPVAKTVEALGLEGMSVATVRRALDKSQLKATFEQAGIAYRSQSSINQRSRSAVCSLNSGLSDRLEAIEWQWCTCNMVHPRTSSSCCWRSN